MAEHDGLISCLGDCVPQAIDWLWPGRLACGKPALVDGDPGLGKSLVTLDLAARFTTSRALPDGYQPPEPLSIMLLVSEDDVEDTVLPRLLAAGADVRRVHRFYGEHGGARRRRPSFPEDCDLLERALHDTGSRLVIADPLLAFLSARCPAANNQMVRPRRRHRRAHAEAGQGPARGRLPRVPP